MKLNRNSILTTTLLFFLAAAPLRSQPTPPAADTNSAPPVEAETFVNDFPRYNDHPVLFTDFTLEKGRTNYGDLVVIKGNTTVNGRLEGTSVTVMGNTRIDGYVAHDLVVVMGTAELGPDAYIDGEAVVVGGELIRRPGAKVHGRETVVDLEKIPGFRGSLEWVSQGLLYGRPLPLGVPWARNIAGLFLLVNLLLLLLFPRPIQACVDTMEKRPIGSLFAGLLVKLLVGLVCVLLIFTVVGILVIPFLIAGFVVSFLFGKITIYRYVGQQLGRQLNVGFLQGPVVSLIIGTVIFYLLYSVPFLGFVAWGFTGIFGLGAVGMTLVETYRSERKKNSPPPAATPPPPTPAPMPVYFAAPTPAPVPMDAPLATSPEGDPNLAFATPVMPAGPAPFPSSTAAPFTAPPVPPGSPAPVPPLTPPEADVLVRAGFWIRLCAFGLDAFLFMVPLMFMREVPPPEPVLLVWLAYHVGLWTWKGTTVGGIVTGLKVVRVDGRPLNLGVSLIRALASIFSAFALGLGFIWTAFSPGKQSWHDKIAGTVIVKVPDGMSLI